MLNRLLKPFVKGGARSKSASRAVPVEVTQLIKEARLLKAVQRYDEACDKLMEAFSIKGAKELPVKERLRLPRYMQIAGRREEGWKLLNNMMLMNTNDADQAAIGEEMSRFMYCEENYREAVLYAVWGAYKKVDSDNETLQLSPDIIRKRVRPIVEKINLAHKIEDFTKELSDHLSATMTFGLDELEVVVNRHFAR